MAPEQADKLAAVWVDLANVVDILKAAQEEITEERLSTGTTLGSSVEGSLQAALNEVRSIQSIVMDMAILSGISSIVDDHSSGRPAGAPMGSDETKHL